MDDIRQRLLKLENSVSEMKRDVDDIRAILFNSYPQLLIDFEDVKARVLSFHRRLSSSDNSVLLSFIEGQSPDNESISSASVSTKRPGVSPHSQDDVPVQ